MASQFIETLEGRQFLSIAPATAEVAPAPAAAIVAKAVTSWCRVGDRYSYTSSWKNNEGDSGTLRGTIRIVKYKGSGRYALTMTIHGDVVGGTATLQSNGKFTLTYGSTGRGSGAFTNAGRNAAFTGTWTKGSYRETVKVTARRTNR